MQVITSEVHRSVRVRRKYQLIVDVMMIKMKCLLGMNYDNRYKSIIAKAGMYGLYLDSPLYV